MSISVTLDGLEADELLARARIPQHVVHRRLVDETVMLNVQTGQYHGLNETGGKILEAIENTHEPGEVVGKLAEELEVSEDVLRGDIVRFCDDLAQRGLIEIP